MSHHRLRAMKSRSKNDIQSCFQFIKNISPYYLPLLNQKQGELVSHREANLYPGPSPPYNSGTKYGRYFNSSRDKRPQNASKNSPNLCEGFRLCSCSCWLYLRGVKRTSTVWF